MHLSDAKVELAFERNEYILYFHVWKQKCKLNKI